MLSTQSPSTIIGNIKIFQDIVLGEGVDSKVCIGSFDGRPVAVKRVPYSRKDPESELNEIDMLLQCDGHSNVVKYYAKEVYKKEYIYIALELCDRNLEDWVKEPSPEAPLISKADILKQTTKGVEYLHKLGIIHRDLKPQNILLSLAENNVLVKITDFGISQKLDHGQLAKTIQTGAGTIGWMAPEILQHHLQANKNPRPFDQNASENFKMTRQTDIFQLGCVFYFVLSNGKHPFGTDFIMQLHNINKGTPTLSLADMEYEHVGSLRLIQLMIGNDPKTRPSASVVLSHHLFWSKIETLNFLTDVSNVTDNRQNMSTDVDSCVKNMEQYYPLEVFRNWVNRTGPEVKHWILNNNFRAYNANDVMDLVRAIRNMKGHFFHSLPIGMKQELGNSLDGLMSYWLKRFPFLVDLIWLSFHLLRNKQEYNLSNYYWKAGSYQFREFSKEEKVKFVGFMEMGYARDTETKKPETENKSTGQVDKNAEPGPSAAGNGERNAGHFHKRGGKRPNDPKWVNKGERDAGARGDDENGRGNGNMQRSRSYGDLTVGNDGGGGEEHVEIRDDHGRQFRGRGQGAGWRGGDRGGRGGRGFRGRQGNNFRGRGRGNAHEYEEYMGGNEIWVRVNAPMMMGVGNGRGRAGRGGFGRGRGYEQRGAGARGYPQW